MSIWSFVIPLVTLVVGIFLGAWFNEHRKRPLLTIHGSGGGGSVPGMRTIAVSVTNPPSFIGISFSESTILGRQIHPALRKGLWVDRNAATKCRGMLYDTSGRHVAHLYWYDPEDPKRFVESVTIACGESRSLMVFARLESEKTKYFPVVPDPQTPGSIKVPEDARKFSDTKEFDLLVKYGHGGNSWFRAKTTMRLDYAGHLYFELKHKDGSSSSLV